jgi:hypothetical protein
MHHFDWPITQGGKNNITETLEAPKIDISMWRFSAYPSAHLYWWEGENFGQTIWDRNVTLLGKILENTLRTWGTSLRICGNTKKGVWWEK